MTPELRLIRGVLEGQVEDVRRVLQESPNVDGFDATGRTPLMIAARAGNLEIARLLLAAGASPDKANAIGTTPLMYAKTHSFAKGDTAVLELLLQHGADVNAVDGHGLTVLDYVEQRSAQIIHFLSAHGARRGRELGPSSAAEV